MKLQLHMTRAQDILTGSALGDLGMKAKGRLVVLRKRLYFIVDGTGKVRKKALHGFMGRSAEALLTLVLQGGGPYTAIRMMKPREAFRRGEKPFRMTERTYRLGISDTVLSTVAHKWVAAQARRFIPFPRPE